MLRRTCSVEEVIAPVPLGAAGKDTSPEKSMKGSSNFLSTVGQACTMVAGTARGVAASMAL